MALMGFFMFSTNFTLFYYASEHVASGLLAVVWSMTSIINIFMVAIVSKSKPNYFQLLASAIGLFGITLIFIPELKISELALESLIMCIIGTVSFCSGNLVSQSLQNENIPVMSANSFGMLYGCFVLIIYALYWTTLLEFLSKLLILQDSCGFQLSLRFSPLPAT